MNRLITESDVPMTVGTITARVSAPIEKVISGFACGVVCAWGFQLIILYKNHKMNLNSLIISNL